jgi:benzoyl-CoA 2,3-dioxygenase component A
MMSVHQPSRLAQRLVDPQACSACYGCFEACPEGAVVIRQRQVAVDPDLCENCRACVDECGTGAIDVLRMVPKGSPYSLDEQLSWDQLPPDEI